MWYLCEWDAFGGLATVYIMTYARVYNKTFCEYPTLDVFEK